MSAMDDDIAPFISIGSAAAAVIATMCERGRYHIDLAHDGICILDQQTDTVVMRGLCCIECAQMLADWLGQGAAS
jgi:NAD-dependent dihydropyrimidine dehydrogenase PreA subunit